MKAHLLPALAMLLSLGACAEPSSTQTLSERVSTRLNPDQLCNRPASIEYLPNGTRVRVPEVSLFVGGGTDLTECGQYALASVVEAMLDPHIMQVVVEPAAAENGPDATLSLRRADMVKRLLSNVGFTQTQPPVLVLPTAVPSQGAMGIVLLLPTVSG
jgi:hypothetical protein